MNSESPIIGELREMSRVCTAEVRPIIENLLSDADNLQGSFSDLIRGNCRSDLIDGPQPWQRIICCVVDTAARYSPERIKALRGDVRAVDAATSEIAELALRLAEKIRYRDELIARHHLDAPPAPAPHELLDEAVNFEPHRTKALFRDWVEPDLDKLTARFELRYWPSLPATLEALADMLRCDEGALPYDDAAESLVLARQAGSIRDFWRALHANLDALHAAHPDIRVDFAPSTFVELANGAFLLDPPATAENYARCSTR